MKELHKLKRDKGTKKGTSTLCWLQERRDGNADVEVADVIGLYRACSVIRMPPFGRKGYHAFWLTTLLRKFQVVSKLN